MYIFVVEFLGVRLAFKSEQEAENYVSVTFGDDTSATIKPCILVGE